MSTQNLSRRALLIVVAIGLLTAPLAWAQDNPVGQAVPEEPRVEADGGPFQRWSDVTVVDNRGWRYEHVSLQWVGDGQALRMGRPDGAVRDFALSEITRVIDGLGRDLTAEVASGRHGEGQPALSDPGTGSAAPGYREIGYVGSSQQATLAEIISPKPFAFALDLSLGYATPGGAWFSGTDDGLNYSVGGRVSTGHRSYLRFLFRHQDLGSSVAFLPYEYYETVTLDSSADEFQILVGFHTGFQEGQKIRNLVYAEFGPSLVSYKVAVSPNSHWSDSVSKLGLTLNGGLILPMAPNFALDVGIDMIYKPGWLSDTELGGLLLGAHAGLVFYN